MLGKLLGGMALIEVALIIGLIGLIMLIGGLQDWAIL
jgi:hypothetical protein